MASPSTNKVLDRFDRLTPPARAPVLPNQDHSTIPSAPTTPTSFKRRTPSKSNLKSTTGLLTGILSRSPDPKPAFLPPSSPARGPPAAYPTSLTTPRAREASAMSSYSNALGSDDDGHDEDGGVGQLPGLGARPAGTRISFGGNVKRPRRGEGGGFLSPGGSAFQSLGGGRKVSRGLGEEEGERGGVGGAGLRAISPGGSEDPEGEEEQVEPTPLPTMSMLVLCICMVSHVSSPFLVRLRIPVIPC